MNRSVHYLRRYEEVIRSHWLKEANRRCFNIISTHVFNRVFDLINSNWKDLNVWSRLLFIESTDKYNWWWLWDWIFKTAMLWDLNRSGHLVDMVVHTSRRDIFARNPDILNLYEYGWFSDIGSLSRVLKENTYDAIMLIYPNWEMMLLALASRNKSVVYFEKKQYEYAIKTNHVEMYRNITKNNIPNLEFWTWELKLRVTKQELKDAESLISFTPWISYIWINVWARSSLRHFKNWSEIIDLLDKKYPQKLRFVLFGKDNTLWIDKEIESRFWERIINMVWKTKNLRQLYALLSLMDLNIWSDWWNINASMALKIPSVPIFSVVDWEGRIDNVFPKENIIKWNCSAWDCFDKTFWMKCTITWQESEDHSTTPPCLSSENLINEISDRCIKILNLS